MARFHNPRCAIFHDPPSLQDPSACNCGAIPPLASASVAALNYVGLLRVKIKNYDEAREDITLTRGEALDIARLLEAGQ